MKACMQSKLLRPKVWHCRKFYSSLANSVYSNSSVISTNIRISTCFKRGEIDAARQLFDEMPVRSAVSWNSVISGYSKWGMYEEALHLVSNMHSGYFKLNDSTFTSAFSVCAHLKADHAGRQLHSLLLKSGLLSFEFVGSALLYFYSSCFRLNDARLVFDELCGQNELVWSSMLVGFVQCDKMKEAMDLFMNMKKRDVHAWTTMISGYSKRDGDECKTAFELFRSMRRIGAVKPNEFTLDCIIRTCERLELLNAGREVHGLIVKAGFEYDDSVASALIELYFHCLAVNDARKIFENTATPGISVSNSLMEGLVSMGRIEDAELVFQSLSGKNAISYNIMIKGYAMVGRTEDSKLCFENMPDRTLISSNTMITVYGRNGALCQAMEIFCETKDERDPVTWNSMISSYIYCGQYEEAFLLFVTMHRLCIDVTRSTFSSIFHACSCIGSLRQGQLIHACLIKTPFESDVYVGTSLIDMYSKCGRIGDAQKSFDRIPSPNVAAYSALINGFADNDRGSEAVFLFGSMLLRRVNPNAVTFVGVLSACCREGRLDDGVRLFTTMEMHYEITPTLEHYACVVDLLGRSGCLQEAEGLIDSMPIEADGVVWGALLGACWHWMNLEIGERVASKMLKLNLLSASALIIMSNIYARLGRWDKKLEAYNKLAILGLRKDPGCSWVELNNQFHVFSVEGRAEGVSREMYATLE
ncbi:hypothetical protein QQ045_014834 [Rhodiola kirilowii]